MTSVFSQKVNKEGINYTYDCSVDEHELVGFTYKNDSEILDYFEIPFPTLRNFMLDSSGNFQFDGILIKDGLDFYRFFNINSNRKIILPKIFLLDSYQVLNNLWEDD